MSIEPDTKRALHFQILSTVKSIESWDLAERSGLMANTSNKYVKYLRDEGHNILTESVDGNMSRTRTFAGAFITMLKLRRIKNTPVAANDKPDSKSKH